jgi:hypothetical protein
MRHNVLKTFDNKTAATEDQIGAATALSKALLEDDGVYLVVSTED